MYTEIKIVVSSDKADMVSDIMMMQEDFLAVTYQDAEDSPILEPLPGEVRLWPYTIVTGLYNNTCDKEAIKAALIALVGDHSPIGIDTLEDQDWVRTWLSEFKPLKFGKRLWICPSSYSIDEEGAKVVTLDPGLAFGTGTHATTALCLSFLADYDLYEREIIDYGCGSGILGIAALVLGAKKVYAIDIDEQALIATKNNATANHVADKIELFNDPSAIKPCSLLVANILAGPLIELSTQIASLVREGGRLALSGLIEEQEAEIVECYSQYFKIDTIEKREGWLLVSGVKLAACSKR